MKPLTNEEFIDRIKVIQSNLIFKKTKYINRLTKVIITCPIHGDFKALPARLLSRKVGCPKCSRNKITKEILQNKIKDEAEIINGEVINNHSILTFRCKKCGKFFNKRIYSILNGIGCNYCSGKNKSEKQKSSEEYLKNKIIKIYGNIYSFEYKDYKRNNVKMKIFCRRCEKYFYKRMSDLLNRSGCPNCSESYEKKFKNYLDKYKVKYEQHKSFDELKDKKKLTYDFFIKDFNLLIELQGPQHYYNIYHKDRHSFHRQLHHDWMKRKYAIDNDYNYLTIDYSDYNKLKEMVEELFV